MSEVAKEFLDLWDNFCFEQKSQTVAKNIPSELLSLFIDYTEEALDTDFKRVYNLLALGYLIRLLEERVN